MGGRVLAVVRELGGSATVVAHSIGGAAAVRAAVDGGGVVDGLVLIGAFAGGTRPKVWMRAASWLVGRTPGLWGMFYGSLFVGGRPADHEVAVAGVKAGLRRGRMVALRAQIGESLSGMSVPYGDVRCPVLVVTGSKDPDMRDPEDEARRIAGQVGGERVGVEMIEGAGHLPHLERVDRTGAAVLEFLKGL